jgi:ferric-dicitrate binding protein FerR (iron transport regulator)
VIIPYGMRSEIKLSDGTKVWLNAGSRLIFPQKFTGKDRHVFLKGEAFFDVAENKNAPFIVTTDNINVTVLGTEFNMKDNNSDSELEVVLVEGAISLKENSVLNFLNKEIKLVPNQKAVYNKIENKMQVESGVDVAYYTSWKEGLLEFRRESILNVFKQLSRYYDVRFVTESNVELNKKISGKLDLKESLEDVMKVISDAAPIAYRFEEGKVYVNSNINYLPMR